MFSLNGSLQAPFIRYPSFGQTGNTAIPLITVVASWKNQEFGASVSGSNLLFIYSLIAMMECTMVV